MGVAIFPLAVFGWGLIVAAIARRKRAAGMAAQQEQEPKS